MATESVAIEAFAGYESGVFLSWMEAVGDVMLNGGEASSSATAQDLGGLFMALSRAAKELQERELEQVRSRSHDR
ncbi:hypothetical protein EIM50_00550 [Pseudoxanthomonas sp. SGD-10]|nr:hypothetical protein EIM50_00550 [Pseudoxanthomonas sp. SGD-10]